MTLIEEMSVLTRLELIEKTLAQILRDLRENNLQHLADRIDCIDKDVMDLWVGGTHDVLRHH